jgi:hypothetical protein
VITLRESSKHPEVGIMSLKTTGYPRACNQSGGDKELLFHAAYSLQMDNGE